MLPESNMGVKLILMSHVYELIKLSKLSRDLEKTLDGSDQKCSRSEIVNNTF